MHSDVVNYLLDAALILMVVAQIRGRRLSLRQLLLPVAIVTYFAIDYLKHFPTSGNDLLLEASGAVFGALLGVGCGITTQVVSRDDGAPLAKATAVAASLWLFGMCGRLFFQVWVEHGGARVVGAFSAANDITAASAWADCLVLMALAEVLGRTLVLAWRGTRLSGGIPISARSRSALDRIEG